MKLETVVGILICVLVLKAIFMTVDCQASPWDEGFQGPVAEETKIDCRKEKCA